MQLLGLAVGEKISDINAKITEFGNLADKSDDDNTAITQLESVQTLLNDVSGLLTVRSVESKKNISCVSLFTKNSS